MDESLDKRTGLNPDNVVGEALTCESTQNQEQGILESVQAEPNSSVDLLDINEASTSQITEPSPASYERFTCTNVTLSETDKAAGFAQNYDLISTRNLSPFPVSDQNITDFVSESLQRINSAVSSDSQKTITNSLLDVEDEFSSGPVTKERKIDDSLPNHLKSETIPVQNFDSTLESSSLNAEDIEKLVRSSLNVSRLLESSEGAGSAEDSSDNSQKAKVKVENLFDVVTLDTLHTQGDNSIVNPENLNPPKIFTVSSAEQLHYESDTPASSASSMSSSYATGDTCGSDCLPANCSLAYACNTSEAEDLSKSQYQGLSGHLMDYYLTMVFPGQPGPLSHLCPDVASAPIEPVFQIGEELIQKSPLKPEEEDDYDSEDRRIILGICAMEKKSRSKPMLAILERLAWFEFIETHIFAEKVILNEPVECWPICDVFVSFHSRGFPLNKAIDYVKLRKPIVVNDLDLQYTLQDRRDIHKILEKEGIPQPRYMIVNRDIPNNGITDNKELPLSDGSFFQELEDSVELDGEVFQKPFVEKPVSAEDHNVYIYFPTAAGGGSQRLFRKVGSRSSIYSNYTRVRKAGSYIYEDFMPTDGTDVKVYTVGPDYAHAEARKSPGLDGKVERDQNGKEIRYPVILSANEKMIARKVTLAFKQTVCGFDLLRANGKSFVCDVNGFSFVKTSSKYYDDCAKVLGTMIMRALAPQLHIPWVLGSAPEDIPVVPTTSGTMMELRCVTAVIRHGDRTPKQKMKMEVKQKRTDAASSTLFERFFDLFEKYDGYRTGQLKLKQPKQLQEVLDIVRQLLQEHQLHPDPEIEEKKAKLEQLKLVLEMYGYFSGINRKVQLKYQPHGRPKKSSSEDDETPSEPSLLLIVKWGGELTPAGKIQAEQLGKAFRSLYPGGQGEYGAPGLGILRLHSTYRHDLKMYASDEGRVQMTAAAFAKGLLALEGELPPILVQMVKCANTNGLLDSDGETSKYQHVVKEKLKDILNQDRDFTELDYVKLAPNLSQSLLKAMRYIKNPYQMCEQVHTMVKEITSKIRRLKIEQQSEEKKLYHGETWGLLLRRWAKLEKDFKMKSGYFDINKIPDIYDCIKYDLQHNQKVLQYENSELLHKCSKALADIVIPQEYGITKEEKLHISQSYCTPLLRKIRSDLAQVLSQDEEDDITRLDSRYSKGVATPHRFVRTRLYFTSESHIHSLLTMLRYGGLLDEMNDEQWRRAMEYVGNTAELNYMTQIVIMMYEDPSKEYTSEERFHVELHFSPGAYSWDNESQPDIHTTKSLSDKPDPSSIQCKRISMAHRPRKVPSCSTIPDRDENVAVETITAEVKETKAPTKQVHLPKSPDPNVPEWDWGEDDLEVKNASQGEMSKLKVTQKRKGSSEELEEDKTPFEQDSIEEEDEEVIDQSPISRPTTQPISIANDKPAISISDADDSRSQSLEEKRSQSFEEKSQGEEACSSERMLRFYTRMRGQRSLSLLEVPSSLPMVERHYLTVQLPLVDPKQKHRHSFANIFTVPGFIGNPDSFRETFTKLYVPSIQPLETLYNSLTLHQLDIFLDRITSVKFMTPASTPPSQLMSPCQGSSPRQEALQLNIIYSSAYSLSSAVNSNMGPPLDTTEDVLMKLRVFMMEKQFSTDTSVYTKIQRDKQSVSFTGYDNPHSHQLSKDGELQKDLGLGPLKGRQGQVHQNIAALASNRSGKLCHVKDCTVKQHSKGYHPHHVHEPHRATKPQTHAKPYRKYICKIFGKRVCPESVDQHLDENATGTTAQSATGKSWLAKVTEQFEDIGLAKEGQSTDTATKPILCQDESSWQQVNSATTSTGSGTSVDRKSKGHKKSQGRVHFLDEDLEKARKQKSAITKEAQSENTDSQKLTDPSKPNIELAPAGNTSVVTDNDAKHLCQKSSDGSSQV